MDVWLLKARIKLTGILKVSSVKLIPGLRLSLPHSTVRLCTVVSHVLVRAKMGHVLRIITLYLGVSRRDLC